ncbi:MAG: hypothetical protein ACR65O_06825 [Methylomicrobium sp.]|jgi:hypothetical protein
MGWHKLFGLFGCDLIATTDWKLIVQILTLVAVIIGWIVVHKMSALRDLANERRKLRVSYLEEAFEKLIKAGSGKDTTSLEEAIAKVQLIGSKEQIDFAIKIGKSLENGNADNETYGKLVTNIRNTLRKEFEMEKIDEKIHYLDMKKPEK